MWWRTRNGWATGLTMVMLAACAGCTISVQPWHKTAPPQTVQPPVDPLLGAVLQSQATAPRPLPPQGPGLLAAPSNETMAQLIKQLNDVDEQRRALADQVAGLRRQLKEREDSLRVASYEVEESTKGLKRTRTELNQWHTEMEELRDRVRRLEDNREKLRPLIEDILNHLERKKESARTPLLEVIPK